MGKIVLRLFHPIGQPNIIKFLLKKVKKYDYINRRYKIYQAKSGQVTAVDNVNLTVNQGEIYGIIGYSGAGKSSLIRLLNGLETPTTGTVEVAGNDIGKIKGGKLRKARQEISMVFQHFNILWSRTVRENIAFPLEIAGISKEKE